MSFSVQVTPDMVPLDPGATTAITVVVVNKGPDADRFELEIEGIDPEWKAIPVAVFEVDAEETHSEKAFIKPPRASESLAGNYPFVVRVRSLITGENRTAQAVAEVKPFHHLSMEIDPKKGFVSPLRRQNSFDVTLVNLGNTEHTLQLLASDPEDACAYEFDSPQVTIGPGQQREVEVVANPTKSPIFSSGRLIGFSVSGRSIDTPSIAASSQAQLEQRPLLTPASLAILLLLSILFGAWLMMMPKTPSVSLVIEPMQVIQGETATVNWNSENARRITVTVGGDVVYDGPEAHGQRVVTLSNVGTITVKAEAVNGDRKVHESRDIKVDAPEPVPLPRIISLDANPKRVKLGQPFMMKFSLSSNVTEAILEPTGENIDPALEQLNITPLQTGTIQYTLVAKNKNMDVVRKSFTIDVYEESDAKVLDFHASAKSVKAEEGGRVTLSWQVTGAERVELKQDNGEPVAVPLTGSQDFTITAKTVFILTAIDAKNRRTAPIPVVVTVEAAPPPILPPTDTGGTDAGGTTGSDAGSTTGITIGGHR